MRQNLNSIKHMLLPSLPLGRGPLDSCRRASQCLQRRWEQATNYFGNAVMAPIPSWKTNSG